MYTKNINKSRQIYLQHREMFMLVSKAEMSICSVDTAVTASWQQTTQQLLLLLILLQKNTTITAAITTINNPYDW